jgi:hypothetical protein
VTAAGVVGAVLLALCGAPQAWQAYRDGHARGVSGWFLSMWGVGCTAMLYHVLAVHASDVALVANYVFNVSLVAIIARFKVWPRRVLVCTCARCVRGRLRVVPR